MGPGRQYTDYDCRGAEQTLVGGSHVRYLEDTGTPMPVPEPEVVETEGNDIKGATSAEPSID